MTVLKIMNLFSFNQYLFSDRTKLNLKKGLSVNDNPFRFYKKQSNTAFNSSSDFEAVQLPAVAYQLLLWQWA